MRSSASPSLAVLAVVLGVCAAAKDRIVCDTTVGVGDGTLIIELWEDIAPNGVQRFSEMVEDGFFTDMPFFRCAPKPPVQTRVLFFLCRRACP